MLWDLGVPRKEVRRGGAHGHMQERVQGDEELRVCLGGRNECE